MASVRQDGRSGQYLILFRYGGRQFQRSLKTGSQKRANAICGRVEETLQLLQLGRLEIPSEADAGDFILSDGKRNGKPTLPKRHTIGDLLQLYGDRPKQQAKEATTEYSERVHIKHLCKHLKTSQVAQSISTSDVQRYIEKRLNEKWRGRPIRPQTVKKEVATFRVIWNWGVRSGYLKGRAPTLDLVYPKTDERLPFITRDEIKRIIDRDRLDETAAKELWESLFLRKREIGDLLRHVEQRPAQPFVYPMFVFAAHTGARRSELLRSQIEDFDFQTRMVRLREKKRSRKNAVTYRHVPMTKLLAAVMSDWFEIHPGGSYTLCLDLVTLRGKRRDTLGALTKDEATDHFKRALNGSEWESVRGFHVLRHSFASNLAAGGVDQRIIDEWMGHTTEEMRRRYRHLFPDQQRQAIDSVFGRNGK